MAAKPPQKLSRFNSQPPEGGWPKLTNDLDCPLGFNSQPPEGGWKNLYEYPLTPSGFNSQPPEGGWQMKS